MISHSLRHKIYFRKEQHVFGGELNQRYLISYSESSHENDWSQEHQVYYYSRFDLFNSELQ